MFKKAMLEIMEKSKQAGDAAAASGDACKAKRKSIIHIEDRSDHVEIGFVVKKRTLEDAGGDEGVVSKRCNETLDVGLPPPVIAFENVFHQLLTN